ncbi:MAG: pilus assembly protein PilM, partial [Chthonomonadales bacterium]|nr:pilus assembly protein PilM [Chthonomonadales bacterium]
AEVLLGEAPAASAGPQETGFYDIASGEAPDLGGFDLGEQPAAEDAFDLGASGAESSVPVAAPSANYGSTELQVFSAIAPTLGELVGEIRRSIEYYQGRHPDSAINEALICGGTAGLKNLDVFLTGELGVPTRIADPFQYATVSARNYSSDHVRDLAPSFAVAMGLAARDFVAAPVAPKTKPAKRGKK